MSYYFEETNKRIVVFCLNTDDIVRKFDIKLIIV